MPLPQIRNHPHLILPYRTEAVGPTNLIVSPFVLFRWISSLPVSPMPRTGHPLQPHYPSLANATNRVGLLSNGDTSQAHFTELLRP